MRFEPEIGSAVPLLAAAFASAALLAFVLTPFVRRWVAGLGMLDRPDPRRVNTRPVPRGGGFAVVGAFLPAALLVLALDELGGPVVRPPAGIGPPQLVGLLGGGVLAVALGFLDDYLQLRARWQSLGQLALAAFAIGLGLTITTLTNPLGSGSLHLDGIVSIGFTAFWIVGMINSINWIDGLDGLSSGIGVIAAMTLGVISLTVEIDQPFVALFCFALAGALLGFLRWNFHPASIFVGTSGVMFVGYTLAVLSILGTAKVAVALLVLGVPIIDTFWIIVRRMAARRSPFSPDRGHIHHRLLDLGLSHTQTVLLIYAICAGLAVLSFVLSGRTQVYAFLGIVVVSGLLLLLITRRAARPDDLEATAYEEGATGVADGDERLARTTMGAPTTAEGGPRRAEALERLEPLEPPLPPAIAALPGSPGRKGAPGRR
ncbi:MAG TPA: MraY family glycosyltransferase [Candidatus Limnocylindrales bacterium]